MSVYIVGYEKYRNRKGEWKKDTPPEIIERYKEVMRELAASTGTPARDNHRIEI